MTTIPIVRAAHVLLYVEGLREIGAPVDRDLAASRLPVWIEHTPDAYVSIPLVFDWIARFGRDVPAAELDFLAARRSYFVTLDARVLVAAQVLALPDARSAEVAVLPTPLSDPAGDWDFIAALRAVLRAYPGVRSPAIDLAAEIAGMSRRTFQRRLAECGLSYSQVLTETRFEVVRDLLTGHDTKIIEVAMASGYESPQNFSGAFRRIAGMSPKEYRRMAVEGA